MSTPKFVKALERIIGADEAGESGNSAGIAEAALPQASAAAEVVEAADRLARAVSMSGPMGRIADLAIGGRDALEQTQAALSTYHSLTPETSKETT